MGVFASVGDVSAPSLVAVRAKTGSNAKRVQRQCVRAASKCVNTPSCAKIVDVSTSK